MKPLSVLILAAGKGVRMKSATPKVLHPVGGVPMIDIVFDTVTGLNPVRFGVIVGHQSEVVRNHVSRKWKRSRFFTQPVLDGSGGAVRRSLSWLKTLRGDVL